MLLVLSLLACSNSKVPEDAIFYDVTVTAENNDDDALVDECHPEASEGYQESFLYAVAYDGSKATIYIGNDVFALGTVSGCDLTYSTVIIGEETEADGPVKWQLTGTASIDPTEGDACVDGDGDWDGFETFEIISTENETLEPGCEYETKTLGDFSSSGA
ncbi:MAG: hypothetical protein Q8P41_05585 [Pseudomonadota bacterium]|nr:hypothetical protein [Pseudomonadota bacterium]